METGGVFSLDPAMQGIVAFVLHFSSPLVTSFADFPRMVDHALYYCIYSKGAEVYAMEIKVTPDILKRLSDTSNPPQMSIKFSGKGNMLTVDGITHSFSCASEAKKVLPDPIGQLYACELTCSFCALFL